MWTYGLSWLEHLFLTNRAIDGFSFGQICQIYSEMFFLRDFFSDHTCTIATCDVLGCYTMLYHAVFQLRGNRELYVSFCRVACTYGTILGPSLWNWSSLILSYFDWQWIKYVDACREYTIGTARLLQICQETVWRGQWGWLSSSSPGQAMRMRNHQ